jgi:hypothetical protein
VLLKDLKGRDPLGWLGLSESAVLDVLKYVTCL